MSETNQDLNSTNEAIKELQKSLKDVNGEIFDFSKGMQDGLTAVAKKLPDVVESIIKLNAANKELAASGGKPQSILSQLAGSMLSWNAAITIGTTLLITYGGALVDWIVDLMKGETKLSAFAKAMKDANIVSEALIDTQIQSRKSAQADITSLELLYRASQNHNLSLQERTKAVNALKQQWPDTFKNISNETILAGKAATAYKSLKEEILATAYAEAAKNKITANLGRTIDNEETIKKESIKNKALLENQKKNEIEYKDSLKNLSKSFVRPEAYDALISSYQRRDETFKNEIAASNKIISNLNTDTKLLKDQNDALANKVDLYTQKHGVKILSPKLNNDGKGTNNPPTNFTPPTIKPPKKKSPPKQDDGLSTPANEAVQLLQTYTNSIKQTNIYYDQLKEKHKSSSEELKKIEEARSVSLLQIQNKFQKEDQQQLAQYKHEINQIAIDNTEDAKQKTLLQLQEDKTQKLAQMDEEINAIEAKITLQNVQLIEINKAGNEAQIEALEKSIKLQQDIKEKAGKVRLDYEKQQVAKEKAIKDGKDPEASTEKKLDDKLAATNQKPDEDPAIAKIKEQQKNWAHEKELAVQAAKDKHQSVFDVEAKFAVMKVNLEAQLVSAKMHKADGFIDAVLKNSKKESAIYKAAFIAKKATSISDTIVTTSEAVMKSFGAYSGIPFIGQALGIAQAAFMAAQGATSIANIVKQKPGMARGGQFISDGRGAVLPGYSRTDNTNAYLRSGEAVVVSEAMRNPWARNLVSAINVAHGGRDFSVPNAGRGYAIGGIFTDGGNANRYYSAPVNDQKDLANTLAYQMINNFPPIYVDVKDVNNQQNILAQTVDRVNL
jgi:hypothetical protein